MPIRFISEKTAEANVLIQCEEGVAPVSAEAEELITAAAKSVVKTEKLRYDVDIEVTITDDENIRTVNAQMRGVDAATDVLSFPEGEYKKPGKITRRMAHELLDMDTGRLFLGDVLINIDRTKLQAEEYGHSPERELAYLTTHSVLHLLGYDHMTDSDKKLMRAHEEAALAPLGLARID